MARVPPTFCQTSDPSVIPPSIATHARNNSREAGVAKGITSGWTWRLTLEGQGELDHHDIGVPLSQNLLHLV